MNIDRRAFIEGAICTTVVGHAALAKAAEQASVAQATVHIHPEAVIAEIPPDFMGLGYEISSVARPGLLSRNNAVYVQLVRTLGPRGVIRIGGNTSDYSTFAPTAQPISAPKATVVNQAVLNDLGNFLEAVNWSLIWGINLGEGSVDDAVAEARAVRSAVGRHLLAIEIGNEPDLFRHEGHRKAEYGYAQFHADYTRFRDALRTHLPGLPLAGPDVAGATDWVAQLAADEGRDLKLLTHHYYREGQSPRSTFDKLLRPDPKLQPLLQRLHETSSATGIPFRICETNSFSGGGRPGVSDRFGAALWALQFMFELAAGGCAGINLETGVNQLGFISSYSPIADDEHSRFTAAPEFYGMLAFAQAGVGSLIRCELDAPAALNISAFATRRPNRNPTLTLINKGDASVDVLIRGIPAHPRASVLRLTAPSLDSSSGITLGGAEVTPAGSWSPRTPLEHAAHATSTGDGLRIALPATSAAIIAST